MIMLILHAENQVTLTEISFVSLTSLLMISSFMHNFIFKKIVAGFPGGTVVESPPADAEDTGLCPGLGRSHMPRSGWAREPWPLSLRVRSLCSATGEATTMRGPCTAKKQNKTKQQKNKDRAVEITTEESVPLFHVSDQKTGPQNQLGL